MSAIDNFLETWELPTVDHAVANVRRNTFPFDNIKTVTTSEVMNGGLRLWAYAVAEWRLVAYRQDGIWCIETHGNVPSRLLNLYRNAA